VRGQETAAARQVGRLSSCHPSGAGPEKVDSVLAEANRPAGAIGPQPAWAELRPGKTIGAEGWSSCPGIEFAVFVQLVRDRSGCDSQTFSGEALVPLKADE
jgi:hypothetical protein